MCRDSEMTMEVICYNENMSKLIIANWKSHKNNQEARTWVTAYVQGTVNRLQATVVLCPAFPLVSTVSEEIKRTGAQLQVGVQTLSPYPAGSYTGGISVKNLEGFPIKYAIVGHSERRQYFHETSNDVAKQVEQALSVGITPIVCVDKDYITTQAAAIADELKPKCIVAYEPASAIGSGAAESVADVQGILQKIGQVFGQVKTLYGGSVSETNIAQYLEVADGVIVGSASLDIETFSQLILV